MHSRGPVFSIFGMRVVRFFCCSHEVFNIFLPRYVPKILPLPLAYAKNGDQQFWIEKFHAANEKAQYASMNHPVFPFLRGQGRGNFFSPCFQRVPIKFPRSQSVPNSTEFYPI